MASLSAFFFFFFSALGLHCVVAVRMHSVAAPSCLMFILARESRRTMVKMTWPERYCSAWYGIVPKCIINPQMYVLPRVALCRSCPFMERKLQGLKVLADAVAASSTPGSHAVSQDRSPALTPQVCTIGIFASGKVGTGAGESGGAGGGGVDGSWCYFCLWCS